MSCNIQSASHASINGSCEAYGGGIVSASYTPSLLNGQHRASITLAGASLTTPGAGDSADLSIGNMELPMQVGGYTTDASVGGISTMTLNLYDKSNRFLDNRFVLLKEECGNFAGGEGLAVLGRKMGSLPNDKIADKIGIITPDSDTRYGDVRKYYEKYSKFEFNIDSLVQQAPGKTLWYSNRDPNGGDTLMSAFGSLIDGELPNGPFDFQGSLRSVIIQVCDVVGVVPYWDMSRNIVKLEMPQVKGSGSSGCKSGLIGSSTSVDFTTTYSQGAVGRFTSTFPGENQSSSGGAMSRYFVAKRIDPIFHIKEKCGSKKMIELDLSGDIGKAMTAAMNPQVFAMSAVQSAISRQKEIPELGITVIDGKINFGSESFNSETIENANSFLADYYSTENQEYSGDVHGFSISGDLLKCFEASNKRSDETPKQGRTIKVGKFQGGKFERGIFIAKKKDSFKSIVSNDFSLTGEGDVLRNYLNVVRSFYSGAMYVIRASGQRQVQTGSKTYGYYVTSNAANSGQSPKGEDGYQLVSLDPFASLADTDSTIKDMATGLMAMYSARDDCFDDFLKNNTVVEFIYALDTNRLKSFFRSGDAVGNKNKDAASGEKDQNFLMYLLVKSPGISVVNEMILGQTSATCFSDDVFEINAKGAALSISEAIGTESNKDIKLSGEFDIGFITNESINAVLEPAIKNTKEIASRKIWYDVSNTSSSLQGGTGGVYIAAVGSPPGGTWKSSMNLNLSINAADIARSNGVAVPYEVTDFKTEGDIYSKQNLLIMQQQINNITRSHIWANNDNAISNTKSYVISGDEEMPDIPSPADGLDSLSIRAQDGKTEISITVGNANLLKARSSLRELKSKNSSILHGYMDVIPNVVSSASNAKFASIANGNIF